MQLFSRGSGYQINAGGRNNLTRPTNRVWKLICTFWDKCFSEMVAGIVLNFLLIKRLSTKCSTYQKRHSKCILSETWRQVVVPCCGMFLNLALRMFCCMWLLMTRWKEATFISIISKDFGEILTTPDNRIEEIYKFCWNAASWELLRSRFEKG